MSGINMATTYQPGGVTSTAQVPGATAGPPDFFYEMARRLSRPIGKKAVDYTEDQHKRKMMKLQEEAAERALRDPEPAQEASFTKYIGGPGVTGGKIASTFGEPGAVFAGWRPGGAGPRAEPINPWVELARQASASIAAQGDAYKAAAEAYSNPPRRQE